MLTIVSGFQRCGSSLMLQMLSAGGMSIYHDAEMGYPSFETRNQLDRADDPSWLAPLDGHALKWLEPQHAMPAEIPHEMRILWMTRDHKQQGKSAVKFMRLVGGIALPGVAARQMAASYRRDEPKVLSAWRRRGEVMVVRFERLIERPHATAMAVSLFLNRPLDVGAMASEVRQRQADCLPGLLEIELVESARKSGAVDPVGEDSNA